MKIYLLFLLILSYYNSYSQDTITLKSGDEIFAKVQEITPTEVKYKRWDNLEGPLIVVFKTDVFMIKYQNGTKDVFKFQSSISQPTIQETVAKTQERSDSMAYVAEVDALRNYKSTESVVGTVLTTVFAGPIFGLIPAIACSSSTPKDFNLSYPNPSLSRDPIYRDTYKAKAHQLKSNRVWAGYVTTTFFEIALVAIILGSAGH